MKILVASDNILSPLGLSTSENFRNLTNSISGIQLIDDKMMAPDPFYGAKIKEEVLQNAFHKLDNGILYTRLEKMFILSIQDAVAKTDIDLASTDTLLIVCTTKGNIDLFESRFNGIFEEKRKSLFGMADVIGQYFNASNKPLVVSNACISGMLGIITASRLLRTGEYKNVVVAGGDIISEFTISGFHAFKAISPLPCRPYDAERSGVTLGEGCGTIVLTSAMEVKEPDEIQVCGGATSNDANHISGPSRDGEGLYISIKNALAEAELQGKEIDYISGHGTATIYNDEMESKAITMAGLQQVPLNSFKGYFGHTLGAAGVIESVATVHSLQKNKIIQSLGFSNLGVSENINVAKSTFNYPIKNCLKTGAGFGGCNASIVFSKMEQA